MLQIFSPRHCQSFNFFCCIFDYTGSVFMQPIHKQFPFGVSGFCVTLRKILPTPKCLKKYYLAFSSTTFTF